VYCLGQTILIFFLKSVTEAPDRHVLMGRKTFIRDLSSKHLAHAHSNHISPGGARTELGEGSLHGPSLLLDTFLKPGRVEPQAWAYRVYSQVFLTYTVHAASQCGLYLDSECCTRASLPAGGRCPTIEATLLLAPAFFKQQSHDSFCPNPI